MPLQVSSALQHGEKAAALDQWFRHQTRCIWVPTFQKAGCNIIQQQHAVSHIGLKNSTNETLLFDHYV